MPAVPGGFGPLGKWWRSCGHKAIAEPRCGLNTSGTLCQQEAFALFCAYPRTGFTQDATESIRGDAQ